MKINTWVGIRTWEEEAARQKAVSKTEINRENQRYADSRGELLARLANSDLFDNKDRQYYKHYIIDYSVMESDSIDPMKGQDVIELIATNRSMRKHLGFIKSVRGSKTTSEGEEYKGHVRWSYYLNDTPVFFSGDLDQFTKTVLLIADSQRFDQEFND